MSKCTKCGNEILTGDIHWEMGLCNNCYNELYKDYKTYISLDKMWLNIAQRFRDDNEKLQDKVADLEAKLAESGKEIALLNAMISTLPEHDKELEENHNQDKISFCIEQLEKVRKFINEKYQYLLELEKQGNLTEHGKGSKLTNEIVLQKLHKQIEELKKEMK